MSGATRLRILIVDDHPLFRDGLRAMFESEPDIELVGEAATGEEAVVLASRLLPDVALMDIQMPDMDGIEATRRVIAASPKTRVLMVTMFENDESVLAAMRAGARGYVVKGMRSADAIRAIRAVAEGEAIFSPAIAGRLVSMLAEARQRARPEAFPELTERERQTLDLMAQGHKNAAIADRLHLSPKTVRNYVTSIFDKLELADRSQAIIRARDAGLG
ncbi:MAG TPA: response regulator transcription factor [Candidatus Dormibacteraeota bacterium]|nr:response regulator transcription factor [Candidatus Dormibacteraeota bacterium]